MVYLVRCIDGTLYCGITNNLHNRLAAHNAGKGCKYTRTRRPVELAAVSTQMTKSDALKLEYRIKQIPASKKLIELQKREANTTMNLKKELQKVSQKINVLSNMIEKMIAAAEEPDKPSKVKKAVAKKAAPKKPKAKKPSKGKAAPIAKKPAESTAVQTVLELIKESKSGVNTTELMEKTGYDKKKIQNLVFKLKKQGMIKSITKGQYVSA